MRLKSKPFWKKENKRAKECVRLHLEGFSLRQIRDIIGYKNHTTVAYHLRRSMIK